MNKVSNKFCQSKSPLLKHGGQIKHSRLILSKSHALSILFFQVALKVKRQHLDLWTLISSNPLHLFSNFILLLCYRPPANPVRLVLIKDNFISTTTLKNFNANAVFRGQETVVRKRLVSCQAHLLPLLL